MATELEAAAIRYVQSQLAQMNQSEALDFLRELVDQALPDQLFCMDFSLRNHPEHGEIIIASLGSYADSEAKYAVHSRWIRTMSDGIAKQLGLPFSVVFELFKHADAAISDPSPPGKPSTLSD